jgi:uncharacterized membrane protein SirB2
MSLAVISILGFMVRGALANNQHPLMQQCWVRIIPHINDSLLLLAAVYLAWTIQANPFVQPWLMAKIVALLVYIALGTIVIKQKGSKRMTWLCYTLAILFFTYIGWVATAKTAWPLW